MNPHRVTIRWQPPIRVHTGRGGSERWRTLPAGYRAHCSCSWNTPAEEADSRRLLIQAEALNHLAERRMALQREAAHLRELAGGGGP